MPVAHVPRCCGTRTNGSLFAICTLEQHPFSTHLPYTTLWYTDRCIWENSMHMKRTILGLAALGMASVVGAQAQTWHQVGPSGGTVISLSADPNNVNKLYLGTADGHVFTSSDEGAHWQLLSR